MSCLALADACDKIGGGMSTFPQVAVIDLTAPLDSCTLESQSGLWVLLPQSLGGTSQGYAIGIATASTPAVASYLCTRTGKTLTVTVSANTSGGTNPAVTVTGGALVTGAATMAIVTAP